MKTIFISCVISAGLFTTGCATLMTPANNGYPISTTPAGARVSINGQVQGETPMMVVANRTTAHLVHLEKEGCPSFDTMISSRMSPWVFGNLLFGGPIGLLIDLSSGSSHELTPTMISVTYGERNGKCVIIGSSFAAMPSTTIKPETASLSGTVGYVPLR